MAYSKNVFCVGANHKSADIHMREILFVGNDEIMNLLPKMIQQHSLEEAFVISTCNRFELIAVCDSGKNNSAEEILSIFLDLQNSTITTKNLDLKTIQKNTYTYQQGDAIKHTLSVASGLDSLVIGETQITGQFKKAVERAREVGTLGPVLTRLSQEALRTSGKVRTYTEIGTKPVSISHAAVDLANKVYGNIAEHAVTIIGAGEMAILAAKNTLKYSPKAFAVVNRTLQKAKDITDELGQGEAHDIEHLESILNVSDIVISSTAASDFVIIADIIKRVQKVRNHKPLFLIDIALPRDIDPKCSDIDNVYLFDIDDLQQVVSEHIEERRLAAEKATGIIIDDCLYFENWLSHLSLKPALQGFRSYLDNLIQQEADKTLNKDLFQNLSEPQVSGIKKLLSSVANKISADAGSNVRSPPEGFYQEQLAGALEILFPTDESRRKNDNN